MFTISEIADKAFNNACKVLNLKKNLTITSVDHDSRRIKKNGLYVAIKGANQDGHKFILDAVRAELLLYSRPKSKLDVFTDNCK
jgi:UDP-N-acetylmuramoyl-L-alanyl-D-glutamate--2,6-diaminopimelate ligase